MAVIASFSVARENGQCQQTRRPWKPGFKGIMKKNKSKKKISRKVAAILIIGGRLKI